jgi:PAS domain S-box-containing protein
VDHISHTGAAVRKTPYPRFLLAAIVDSFDDPIISKDLDGTITSWKGCGTCFGYRSDEMIGQPIPHESHHEEVEILNRLRSGEQIDHFETVCVTRNGQQILVSVTISPIRDDEGHMIEASKIVRDISNRKRDDELRAQLAAIVSSADDAIVSKI